MPSREPSACGKVMGRCFYRTSVSRSPGCLGGQVLSEVAIMPAHSRATLEWMLPLAESFVARGAELIRQQEARVAALQHKGAIAMHSENLLALMRDSQHLQINHVALLRRELGLAT
jgi:hypothetical protein